MTNKYQNKYRISSARAHWWDYGKNGAYFITICTARMVNYFWNISTEPTLSDIGKQARQFWLEIPSHFPFVKLDEFVIMSNHVHGIIIIDNPDIVDNNNVNIIVETGHALTLHRRFRNQGKNTVSAITGSFKSAVTRWCNENGYKFGWQSRFHDHIIRTDTELNRIRKYIINNPSKK